MKKFHLAATIVAPLAFITVAGDAQAVDNKFYPGLTCYKDFPQSEGVTPKNLNGTMINPSTSGPAYVVCPLVRDGTSIASANVRVIDRGGGISIGGGLFWCGLVYEKAIGTDVFQASSSDFSTGPGPNAQDINFTGLSGGDYYYGVCTIPKKVSGFSQVIRWQLTEN